ncbi:MAG: hypothetical protein EHJ94_03910 [Deltaproteobacteria bacterium]|nr:MAG: hypothetical protein EHJ94_03910 [Deltaproteobacteria bacterium]
MADKNPVIFQMHTKGDRKMDDTSRINQMRIAWTVIVISYIIVWIAPFFTELSGQAFGSAKNFSNMRDYSHFNWSIIAFLGVVSFAYSLEIEKKNWSAVFAGLAFVLMDTFNEIWNGLIYTATGGYSAYWMVNYNSSYQVLIGWNVEIIINFLFWGLIITKSIPEDKNKTFFGINNRIVLAFCWGVLPVIIEIVLNSFDALIWNYWWWSARFPLFLLILAYFPFALMVYNIYDLPTTKQQAMAVGIMAGILFLGFAIFLPLGWI